jgi:butyryl-CoA dehydrogenase
MQAFGHMVIAWMWLEVALATLAKDAQASAPASQGRLAATRYFFHYELPKLDAWLKVVSARDLTCAEVDEAAF